MTLAIAYSALCTCAAYVSCGKNKTAQHFNFTHVRET